MFKNYLKIAHCFAYQIHIAWRIFRQLRLLSPTLSNLCVVNNNINQKINMMKKILLFVMLASPFGALKAQSSLEKEPYSVKNLASESIGQLQVETSGGSIFASAANPSEAR